jgi:two-component system cell cycle response regulator DivK
MSDPSGAVVLIVDDNEKNMKLARDVLRLAGFQTVGATTGGESIEAATRHLPDVILMDIRLPDMDGTDAARAIRADPRTTAIPIIALTSLAMKGDRELLLASGFDGYLEKPISVSEFPEQVRSFVRLT